MENNEYLTKTKEKFEFEVPSPEQTKIEEGGLFNNKSSKFSSEKESELSNIEISNQGVVFANWVNIANISGKVLEILDDLVVVDCLVDVSPKRYEKRMIRRTLFKDISLNIGGLLMIRVFENPPESKFVVLDGEGTVPESDFSTEGLFSNIEQNRLFKK